MLTLIIIFVALCIIGYYLAMPQPLKVGVYVAAGIVLLLIILNLLGVSVSELRRYP